MAVNRYDQACVGEWRDVDALSALVPLGPGFRRDDESGCGMTNKNAGMKYGGGGTLSNSAPFPLALPFWIPAFGTFAQHLLQSFPFDLPRPLGPFPLTLTLSHGGERGFSPPSPSGWTFRPLKRRLRGNDSGNGDSWLCVEEGHDALFEVADGFEDGGDFFDVFGGFEAFVELDDDLGVADARGWSEQSL